MNTPSRWMLTGAVLAMLLSSSVILGQPATTQPADVSATQPASLPHIRVDLQAKIVELEATVIRREADWLELLACLPGTRTHEAILTVPARPSHIHLALVMIGLEPGVPMSWRMEGEQTIVTPAHGAQVKVTVVLNDNGSEKEIPVSQWIKNQKTGEPMTDEPFLFTGSRIMKIEDKSVYLADLNGSVISLVNFSDDLLVRNVPQTNMSDEEQWGPHTEQIPAVGTPVKIRLRPAMGQAPANR